MKNLKPNWRNLTFAAIAAFSFLFVANSFVIAQDKWAADEEWCKNYKIGDKIQHTISGSPSDFQTCTVTENNSGDLMRVRCEAFKYWVAGIYTASKASTRPVPKAKTPPNNKPTENEPDEPQNVPPKQTGGNSTSLKIGEYACTGSGGRMMIGLGFKVISGSRYTNLDGDQSGTFTISDGKITFRGGHLDGVTGRDLKDNRFTVASQAQCGPY